MHLRRRRDNVVVKCRLFIVDVVVVVVVVGGRRPPLSCRPTDLLWRWTRLFITRRAEQLPSSSIRPCRTGTGHFHPECFFPAFSPRLSPHQTLPYSTYRHASSLRTSAGADSRVTSDNEEARPACQVSESTMEMTAQVSAIGRQVSE